MGLIVHYSLGFVDGGRDSIAAVRPDLEKRKTDASEFEAVKATAVAEP